ncbi:riboflavin synthase [Planctobacterium marinum]|uniref:riboflavin synthase n=1 Tax=Planctobacterium marinum TaxID=1631968 RepID=UPI001E521464|nr:riboflavin synthase [Planctobacterium marinum]MCC2606012.1 riboflavin synthase [Planctobacterium marinum]
MFTGIIESVGSIASMQARGSDMRVSINVGKLDMADVQLGDSIATNGVCLTVVEFSAQHYVADVSMETIKRTGFAAYQQGMAVNLEKALMATSRLGGHIVSGHVDGVGEIASIENTGQTWEIWVKAPDNLARYIAEKGSITVDGVSLTVNDVQGAKFKLTLVPHTLQETIIQHYQTGTRVNLEVDVIARYLERLMLGDKAAETTGNAINLSFLAENGYLR